MATALVALVKGDLKFAQLEHSDKKLTLALDLSRGATSDAVTIIATSTESREIVGLPSSHLRPTQGGAPGRCSPT